MPKGNIKIPVFAKKKARLALNLQKKLAKGKKTKATANLIRGIKSANFLTTHKVLTPRKIMEFHRFHQRIKNCRTKRCESLMNLYGGRKFLKTKIFRYVRRKITTKKTKIKQKPKR